MISIICPVFNEQDSIESFLKEIHKVFEESDQEFEILFVDDGSRDNTYKVIQHHINSAHNLRAIKLSRNFGKEAALTAGLAHCKGTAAIPIDVDLQDPPALILELIKKWRDGYKIVLAKRCNRAEDSKIKSLTATMFYKFHNKLASPCIPQNVGDFRLMDRQVIDAVNSLPERQRFMKGIFSWVGFNSCTVEFPREARTNGDSKFSYWKLWNLALEAFTSFSTLPLRVWTYIGAIVAGFAFVYGIFIILLSLANGIDVPGYSSLLVTMLFLGGVQLIGIGVLGEYIGRIYMESKNRPIYIIEEEI